MSAPKAASAKHAPLVAEWGVRSAERGTEQWVIQSTDNRDVAENGIVADLSCMDGHRSDEEKERIAQRLVACYNACAGIADPSAIHEMIRPLIEAVESCPCSLKERDSGHRVGCKAPGWNEILDRLVRS